ncbi:hypothetical protein P8452_49594 [Trifolium repens]|nr:hypothetical protein P8452_49594 [Trifolium repens]
MCQSSNIIILVHQYHQIYRYSIWDVIFFEGRDCQFRRINDDNIPRFMNSVASSMKMDILQGSMLLSTTFSLAGSRAGSDESTPNKLST